MIKEIGIQVERQNHGDWIRIFIPYPSDEKMLAVSILDKKLNDLKNMGAANLTPGTTSYPVGSVLNQGTLVVTISAEEPNNPKLKSVSVKITWLDKNTNTARDETMATEIYQE